MLIKKSQSCRVRLIRCDDMPDDDLINNWISFKFTNKNRYMQLQV